MPPKKITVSKYDAYLAKIIYENSKLTQNTNDEILNYNSAVESLKNIEKERDELEQIYNVKYGEYEKKRNNDNFDEEYDKLEKELKEIENKVNEYDDIIKNGIPKDSSEIKNSKQYYDEVIKTVNRFQTTIDEPKNLNLYFIELLMELDSKKITYKNRLIFLNEFQKHLYQENIISGMIDALEKRQQLIKNYNLKDVLIKEEKLEGDMGLSIYIHQKYPRYTIDEIYNSFINNLIYKRNVYLVSKYAKSKINDNFDSCKKFSIYYKILKYLDDFNEPDINKFYEYNLNIK